MSHELYFTSAPRGLRPGAQGYCTVAATQGLPPGLIEQLEALSGYRHLFKPTDPRAALAPVAHSHLKLVHGGRTYHVLSRVCAAGLDYTDRTNHFAHHVILEPDELPEAGPAWLLLQPRFLETRWGHREPHLVPVGRQPPRGTISPEVCRAWQELAGDAGWAGVLAETAEPADPAARRRAYLLFQPGQDPLPLLAEALALLPERRWQVTFNTYCTDLPPDVPCLWRCVPANSNEAREAKRTDALIIALGRDLGPASDSPLVAAARTGRASGRPATVAPRRVPATTGRPIVASEADVWGTEAAVVAAPPSGRGALAAVGLVVLGLFVGMLLTLAVLLASEAAADRSLAGALGLAPGREAARLRKDKDQAEQRLQGKSKDAVDARNDAQAATEQTKQAQQQAKKAQQDAEAARAELKREKDRAARLTQDLETERRANGNRPFMLPVPPPAPGPVVRNPPPILRPNGPVPVAKVLPQPVAEGGAAPRREVRPDGALALPAEVPAKAGAIELPNVPPPPAGRVELIGLPPRVEGGGREPTPLTVAPIPGGVSIQFGGEPLLRLALAGGRFRADWQAAPTLQVNPQLPTAWQLVRRAVLKVHGPDGPHYYSLQKPLELGPIEFPARNPHHWREDGRQVRHLDFLFACALTEHLPAAEQAAGLPDLSGIGPRGELRIDDALVALIGDHQHLEGTQSGTGWTRTVKVIYTPAAHLKLEVRAASVPGGNEPPAFGKCALTDLTLYRTVEDGAGQTVIVPAVRIGAGR